MIYATYNEYHAALATIRKLEGHYKLSEQDQRELEIMLQNVKEYEEDQEKLKAKSIGRDGKK